MESLTPVVNYILEGEFPKEFTAGQRRKLIKQASTFLWLEGALYQKGKDLVCRRVPSTNEIPKILKGLHEEACGGHFSHELTLKKAVIANGPFEKWEIDAMGPLPRIANGKLYILVAIDYMTRFGTPLEIVSDNGPGFRRGLLTEVCRQEQNNDEAWIDRLLNLVEIEWKREAAYHCYEKKALQLKDKLNEGIKDKQIKEKSLVLRYNNTLDNRFDAKFERRWEGPFIVKKSFTGGYYQLMDLNGKEHPRKVNGYRLKPYLSRILPAVFETKQVSKKTKKDEILNEVARHEKYTVCDGYSGYFQIRIAEEDQKKTTFITPWGCYAFWVMPFGLTNAPATFQRFMNHVFQAFFGKSIRVYIDDFCIYSSKALHVQKVEEGLQRLNGFGGQINPDKCHIGEDKVILLGHKISQRGIEVDPAKAKALLELPSPKSIKEVTSFMQKVKYMARFIHLASELLHPLQKLTQQVEFAWSEDLEEYFKSIKMVLSELPTLMPPCWDFPFFVNPSVGTESIGAILLQQDPQSSRMRPVYFTSRVTTNIEKGYSEEELIMLCLIFAMRKFRSYLLTKPFVILTSKNLLPWVSSQMTMSPRISKWLMELQSYEYTFKVENSVRAQLAGILTYQLHEKVIKVPNVRPLPPSPPKVLSNAYTLFFDGAFRRATGKAGEGLVLVNPEGEVVMKEQVTLDGSTSNNEAEYDILISGLKIA
ncbi:hypothetical protein L7F22_046237 [Adiantum nelumboides]|nr:hypothetical protein [Adiantum nelumboides]